MKFGPVVAACSALVVAVALTPLVRRFALAIGAVDAPGGRRVHGRTTARLGGLAIVLGYVTAFVVVRAAGLLPLGAIEVPTLAFLGGGILIALVGALDDIRGVGAKVKLAAQIAAATVAWLGGARLSTLDAPVVGHIVLPSAVSYAVTVFWLVAFVNAVNLIDGLDGLAGGLAFFAAVTNTIVALITENHVGATINAALGGAVVGFLVYNFNPATIFMGDTGSMFLGFVLGGATLLTGRQKESTIVSLLVPVIALGLPVTDTIFAMVRRAVARRSIFAADRGHIHHRLLDLGITHRRAVLILYGCTVLLCASAIAVALGKDWAVGAALIGALITLLGIARFAGYFQSQMLRNASRAELLSGAAGDIRRELPDLVVTLQDAGTRASVWARLERFLASSKIVHAEYCAHAEPVPVWRWAAEEDTDALRSGVSILAFPVRSFPGAQPGTLRLGVRSDADNVALQTYALLQVAADVTELALVRVNADRPSSLVRRVETSR
jgi:UDP-GlcNAc:undecaprenyl-phosphate GlcNAc-1-phosphate transferase